jgi:cap2 methyltransferase
MFNQHRVFKSDLNQKVENLDRYIAFKSKDEANDYIKKSTNNKAYGFQSCHFGQRKLLLSEIMFLLFTNTTSLNTVNNSSNSSSSSNNNNSTKIKRNIVYAGAAPCDHIFFLSKLFPDIHFDLIDPAKWNHLFCERFPDLAKLKQRNEPISTYVYSDNIKIHHGYFTDEMAHDFADKYKCNQVLFISDIRPVDDSSKEDGNYLNWEKVVVENMEEQKRWHTIIHNKSKNAKNNWTLLKFKPTFEIPLQSYLKGELFFQPYPPLLSAECRLITNSIEEVEYNCVELEKLCFYHNIVERNTHVPNFTNSSESAKGLNGLYDTKYEYDICIEYSKQYPNQFKTHFKTIFNMMVQISESLGKYGGYNKFLEMYPFQKGYKAPPFIREKWVSKIIDMNNGFNKE